MSRLCECGCGQPTLSATYDYPARDVVKGQPMRYIHGHNTRRFNPGYSVDIKTGCWVWTGAIDNKGYGRTPGNALAHREQYVERFGPIPRGRVLHHTCRNRRCVNPFHLQPLTRRGHSGLHQEPVDKALVCSFCGTTFQASKRNVSRARKSQFNICGSPVCRSEAGRRSAEKRWRNHV